jgi:hypothetical protein
MRIDFKDKFWEGAYLEKIKKTIISILGTVIAAAIALGAGVLATRPADTQMRLPRIVYIKADKLLSVDSVDDEAIDLQTNDNKIAEMVKVTNLPNSFVGVVLISISNDVPANYIKIPYICYKTDIYKRYGYSNQNDYITRNSGEKGSFEKKTLGKENKTLAIPFCITEPITDISIDQLTSDYLNSRDHIIVEYVLEEVQYKSSSRSTQGHFVNFFFPPSKVFTQPIEPMQDIRFSENIEQ